MNGRGFAILHAVIDALAYMLQRWLSPLMDKIFKKI